MQILISPLLQKNKIKNKTNIQTTKRMKMEENKTKIDGFKPSPSIHSSETEYFDIDSKRKVKVHKVYDVLYRIHNELTKNEGETRYDELHHIQ